MELKMDTVPKELALELLSIFGVLGSAWLVSNSYNAKERSLFQRIFKRYNKIDNIYQLLPILQKNSKKLFLFFTDLANSVRTVRSTNTKAVTREMVEGILSQEYYKNKIVDLQNEVFGEFNVDSLEVQRAIRRFSQDDQVEFYVSGVRRMYECVLNGSYPQCPGVELNPEISEQKHLEILEKLYIAKTRSLVNKTTFSNSPGDAGAYPSRQLDIKDITEDPEFEEIVVEEMRRYGYDCCTDAFVALKNSENYLSYSATFLKAKLDVLAKVKRAYTSTDVQKVTPEELELILDTCEPDTWVMVLIFGDLIDQEAFKRMEKVSLSKRPLEELGTRFKLEGVHPFNSEPVLKNGDLNKTQEPKVNGKHLNGSANVNNANGGESEDTNNAEEKCNIDAVTNGTKEEDEEGVSVKENGKVKDEGELRALEKGNHTQTEKVITLWMFEDEFRVKGEVKSLPALAMCRSNSVEAVLPL